MTVLLDIWKHFQQVPVEDVCWKHFLSLYTACFLRMAIGNASPCGLDEGVCIYVLSLVSTLFYA